MHYRLSTSKPLRKTVPAIAASQLDAAISELKSADRDHRAIHAARKHFKKTKALLGLVKPVLGAAAVEAGEKHLASAAHGLAQSRDAEVAVSAAEELQKEFSDDGPFRAFSDLISFLRARRERFEEKMERSRLRRPLKDLKKAKTKLLKLDLRSTGMSDLLRSASKTYKRGRRAMKTALDTGDDKAFHQWRKQAQQHWRQMRLLREAWPKESERRVALLRRLSDLLGKHHDLSMLHETITSNPGVFQTPADAKAVESCIAKKQEFLANAAVPLGKRIYAEKTKTFSKRLRDHWHNTKQKLGEERNVSHS